MCVCIHIYIYTYIYIFVTVLNIYLKQIEVIRTLLLIVRNFISFTIILMLFRINVL